MPPELLLLIIAFVLLPLAQQLLRALDRQRTANQKTGQASDGGQPERRSAAGAPLGRGPTGPRVQETARHEFAHAAAHEFAPPLGAAAPAMSASPVRPISRRHLRVARLRKSPGLRRGIVLMTILGPCRAIDPYAWPERTARR